MADPVAYNERSAWLTGDKLIYERIYGFRGLGIVGGLKPMIYRRSLGFILFDECEKRQPIYVESVWK
jgi:hypothetical protein